MGKDTLSSQSIGATSLWTGWRHLWTGWRECPSWGSSMWDYTVQIQLWFGYHLFKMPPNPNESLWLKVLLLPHALSTGDLQRRLGLLSCSFWQGIHSLFSISILSFVWPDPLLYMVQYRFWYKQCCHFGEVLDWGMCLQKGLWTQTFCAS